MSKTLKNIRKTPKDTLSKHSKNCSSINGNKFTKTVIPKKIVVSKKISKNIHDGKSCSTGVINKNQKYVIRPKKTTKSEEIFSRNLDDQCDDYCKECGDYVNHIEDDDDDDSYHFKSIADSRNINIPIIIDRVNNKVSKNDSRKSIQQYYKNEKFKFSTNSIIQNKSNFIKDHLDTIKEDSEGKTKSEDNIFEIYTTSDKSGDSDLDNEEDVRKLKEFREKNYFECHSAKSRLKTKASVTSLNNHKCVYRFYLNDRLFPVPLSTDFNGTVRCVECHLPINARIGDDDKINGTIQAKVKLDDKVQNLTLLLPVKEPLIIKERRKEEKMTKEVVYFGVVKLDRNGDSLFNRVLPVDSLALRYQKGFKEFNNKLYRYDNLKNNDILFI